MDSVRFDPPFGTMVGKLGGELASILRYIMKIRHGKTRFQGGTESSCQTAHGVVYQTARTDLLGLAKRRLFTLERRSGTMHFAAHEKLRQRLKITDRDVLKHR